MNIITFKMWEDAAANSAGGGGIDGIGVGAKGEPGVHLKKKKKKEEELLKKMRIRMSKKESSRLSKGVSDWEDRGKLSKKVRSDFWKGLKKKK